MVTIASRPRRAPAHRLIGVMIACLGAGIVGGCTHGDDGAVASLTSNAPGSGGSPAVSAQRASAEALYACLADADLPATLSTLGVDGDQASIAWEDGHKVMERVPDTGDGGWVGISGEVPVEDQEAFAADNTSYGLVVDGMDRSTDFERCHLESGYTAPQIMADPADELAQKQAQAEATNAWIACAREHGYPDLADVTAVVDNWSTQPTAMLPSDITEQALRTLLAACPSFDVDKAKDAFDPDTPSLPGEFTPPMIHVPLPGEAPDGTMAGESAVGDATMEKYTLLNDIILEDNNAFWDDLMNNEDDGGTQ
ncbi:MAG: hypothetical protein LBK72_10435 [Bifidobacteriaceae bacterium]|jgi:hypothetical protein|nr:hypothetical protein [Bifidobacteriaceae bacterium]